MSYIDKINSFWDSVTINPLSTGQVSLYFALLHINNRSNWTEWFTAPNQVLSILTGLSRSGISKARNELKQRGVIDFKERGTKATIYKLQTIANSKQDGVQNGNQNSKQDGVQNGNQNSSTLKRERNRQRQKSITNVIPEKHVENEALNRALLDFVAFRKEIRAEMGVHAIRLLVGKLETMAPGDEAEKIAILDQSIMNGWKGVFPLKEQQERGRPQSKSAGKQNAFHNFEQRDVDYDALVMQQLRQ